MGMEDMLPHDYIERSLNAVKKLLIKAADEKNYPVALNLRMLFATERQMQLLGIASGRCLRKCCGLINSS